MNKKYRIELCCIDHRFVILVCYLEFFDSIYVIEILMHFKAAD